MKTEKRMDGKFNVPLWIGVRVALALPSSARIIICKDEEERETH